MKLHRGTPANHGVLSFHTGTLHSKPDGVSKTTRHYVHHALRRMYGVSFGSGLFIGWMRFVTTHESETCDGLASAIRSERAE